MYTVSLPWGGTITYYAFLLIVGALVMGMWVIYRAPNHGASVGGGVLFVLLSGVLGLFLGRAVYCGVRFTQLFYDPRGDYIGLLPFIDPELGGVNVIGVLLGVILAAALTRLFTKSGFLDLLDSAALPGMVLFAFSRFIEPLSGMGTGDLVLDARFMRLPFAIENSMGDYVLAVCLIEAALACVIVLVLIILSFICKKSGTLAGVALVLLCVTQIMPESLRLDDVLYLFIFARVTQMGYGVILMGVVIGALIRGVRRGLGVGTILLELFLMLLGVAVCVGAEYALDKTNWPDLYVYAGMIAALVMMGYISVHRLLKEDRFNA